MRKNYTPKERAAIIREHDEAPVKKDILRVRNVTRSQLEKWRRRPEVREILEGSAPGGNGARTNGARTPPALQPAPAPSAETALVPVDLHGDDDDAKTRWAIWSARRGYLTTEEAFAKIESTVCPGADHDEDDDDDDDPDTALVPSSAATAAPADVDSDDPDAMTRWGIWSARRGFLTTAEAFAKIEGALTRSS